MFAMFILTPLALAFSPLILVIFPIVTIGEWLDNKKQNWLYRRRQEKRDQGPQPPGIIRGYFWAVKNKVCPLIRYVD